MWHSWCIRTHNVVKLFIQSQHQSHSHFFGSNFISRLYVIIQDRAYLLERENSFTFHPNRSLANPWNSNSSSQGFASTSSASLTLLGYVPPSFSWSLRRIWSHVNLLVSFPIAPAYLKLRQSHPTSFVLPLIALASLTSLQPPRASSHPLWARPNLFELVPTSPITFIPSQSSFTPCSTSLPPTSLTF